MTAIIGNTLAWIWSRKLFFGVVFASTLFFFVIFFPFGDLSDLVTSSVARGTGNQVYVQFDDLDLHLLPQPALSVTNATLETALPAIEAQWIKVTPGLFGVLFNVGSLLKAAQGDPAAANALISKLSLAVDAEGLWGGDAEFAIRPGSKTEGGKERSRVSLALEKVNLADVQRWSDLSMKVSGQTELDTDVQWVPDFSDQPEGEYSLAVNKLKVSPSTLQIPLTDDFGNKAFMPVNLPGLEMDNASFKGRLVGGSFIVEEGRFGKGQDSLVGRVKGNMQVRFQRLGAQIAPVPGNYNFSVEMTASKQLVKELSFVFFMLDKGKVEETANSVRYLFRISGQVGYNPNVTRIDSF